MHAIVIVITTAESACTMAAVAPWAGETSRSTIMVESRSPGRSRTDADHTFPIPAMHQGLLPGASRWKTSSAWRGDPLALREQLEPRRDPRLPEQRSDAALPEREAEHARGAQHAAGIGLHPGEPRLDHREHGLRQAALPALGRGPDQLLQVE